MTGASVETQALLRQLKQLDRAVQQQTLVNACTVGILPLHNEIVRRSPYLTGTYRRGWHWAITEQSHDRVTIQEGNNVPYGARLEFGFMDTDSLGREYTQPAKPHVRPAIDATRQEIIDEINFVLREAINDVT